MRVARRLLSAVSTVDSELPYNWNWQRRWTEVRPFLEANPLVLFDIGARGAAPPELDSLRTHIRRIGFEPDPDECARLNSEGHGEFFPALLADSVGRTSLHLYRERSYSSTRRLSPRYERLWSGEIPLDQTLTVDATTLDAFIQTRPDLVPDMIKVDTQGSELAVLQGGTSCLNSVTMIEVEVEFTRIYRDQPLFGDIYDFLAGAGFELLYLNRTFASRRQIYQGPSRGQVIFADALFGRREDRLAHMSVAQLAKYSILLAQYGHVDVARQLVDDFPSVRTFVPALAGMFRDSHPRIVRALLMQVDKVLAAGIHLRGYNQRSVDSDRAWPIR